MSIIGAAQQQDRNRAVGGLWTPTNMSGTSSPATSWHDGSNTASITHSSGEVSLWNDLSGQLRHYKQSVAGKHPTTGAFTQNGLNVIDFNSQFMELDTGGAAKAAMFIVFVPDVEITHTSSRGYLVNEDAGTEEGIGLGATTGTIANEVVTLLSVGPKRRGISNASLASMAADQPHILSLTLGADWFMGVNGSENLQDLTLGTVPAITMASGFVIGGKDTGASMFNGKVCEIIATDIAPDPATRLKIEGYAAHKWGATLASGHLYKPAAPTL